MPAARDATGLRHAPVELPLVAGLDVAAGHVVCDEDRGAWSEVIPLPDGSVGLLVADVEGAALTTQLTLAHLRESLTAFLEQGAHPDDVCAWLAKQVTGANVSASLSRWQPRTGHCWCITLGTPPPLILSNCRAEVVHRAGGAPLEDGRGPKVREFFLAADEVIVLVTDGLLLGHDDPSGQVARLAELAADVAALPAVPSAGPLVERVCRTVTDALAPHCSKDATVLAAQRRSDEAMDLTLPASHSSLGRLRSQVHDWSRPLHLRPNDLYAIEFMISEAAANSVEHGYAGGAGDVHARAELGRGAVHLTVDDHGQWREPTADGDDRRLGLRMIDDLADSVTVHHDGNGTTVQMSRQLGRRPHTRRGPRPTRADSRS